MEEEESEAWRELKADLARRAPGEYHAANRELATSFVVQAVQAAYKMLNMEDKLKSEKALIDATIWSKQFHRELDKALTEKVGVNSSMSRFSK